MPGFGSWGLVPAPLDALTTRDGDAVQARGTFARRAGGGWLLSRTSVRTPRPDLAFGDDRMIATIDGQLDEALIGHSVNVVGRIETAGPRAAHLTAERMWPAPGRAEVRAALLPPKAPPCATPAGGWPNPRGHGSIQPCNQLQLFIDAHPDRFGALWVARDPDGPWVRNAEGGVSPIQVLVVGTTQDLTETRRTLTHLYDGALCVYPVPYSFAYLRSLVPRIRAQFDDRVLQLRADGSPDAPGRIGLEVSRVTPADADALRELEDALAVVSRIQPVEV